MNRILSRLYSQPLMIEANAWRAFEEYARTATVVSPARANARVCDCDEILPEPRPRYLNVLELRRLAPVAVVIADPAQENGLALTPADTAIITIEGMIVKHADPEECEDFGLTDLDDVDAALALVAADANIRNVLLNFVNNPGGTIIGIPETAARIADLCRTKNVISFSDSQCTSGGTYLASQASEFFITESTYTGSIGVIRPPVIDISEQLKANGVKATIIKSGQFKDTGSMLRPITPEEVAMLLEQSDRIMKMFTDAVKRGRPRMTADAMQGQVFFGSQAVEVGLADAVLPDMAAALAAF
jgi:signal peptide peptidase SppA